jgi:hypothetical protein
LEDSGRPDDKSMEKELQKISISIKSNMKRNSKLQKKKEKNISQIEKIIKTNLPFTDCPWCGSDLFISERIKQCCYI